MQPSRCPTREQLAGFVLGTQDFESVEALAEHIDSCATCGATVAQLEAESNTLLSIAPGETHESDYSREEACQRVLSLIAAFGRDPSLASGPPADLLDEESDLPIVRDYRLLEKLGQGGMGEVYKALHTQLDKLVALKLLPVERTKNGQAVARFKREMKAVGKLEHPHLVRALDAGEFEGRQYLVMEYVAGLDLSELVKQLGPLPVADACELVRQAAIGLQHAHEHGLVHRDIKPSNLMLSESGQVKVLDLGLALLSDQPLQTGGELTATGQLMGTFDYMAPEQGGDSHAVDARADIYSLGATLYKLLCGEAPFASAEYATPMSKLVALATVPPRPLRSRRDQVPGELDAIVHRMLAKSPQDRFATAADVAAALKPFTTGSELHALVSRCQKGPNRETRAAPPALDTSKLTPGDSVALAPAARPQAKAPRSFRTLLTAFAAVAAVLLAGVVIRIATNRGDVVIECSDPGIKIAIKRSGRTERELMLQVGGNDVRLWAGDYEVEIVGAFDDIRVENDRFTLSRGGLAEVRIYRDTRRSSSDPSATTRPSPRRTDAGNPFVLIRGGQTVREFKTWAGVWNDHQKGDTIEIHGNGPFPLSPLEWTDTALTIRAAPEYRPRLELAGRLHLVRSHVVFDGCDVTASAHSWVDFEGAPLELRNCRLWGLYALNCFGPKLTIRDSLVRLTLGFGFFSMSDVEIHNSLVRCSNGIFTIHNLDGHKFQFKDSTFLAHATAPAPARLFFFRDQQTGAPIHVEAEGNLFSLSSPVPVSALLMAVSLDFSGPPWSPENCQKHVRWSGRDNLYHGRIAEIRSDDGKEVVARGLAAITKIWGAEQGSRDADSLRFAFDQGRWGGDKGAEVIGEVATAMRQKHAFKELGPAWELVGPGDAYLRARAADGQAVRDQDLRPEPTDAGPFVLRRADAIVDTYQSFQKAADAAADGDILEIWTDKPTQPPEFNGDRRRLTVRAGPGYRPVLTNQLTWNLRDRLTVEGIRFQVVPGAHIGRNLPAAPRGGIVRLANCTADGGVLYSRYLGTEDRPAEIVNCRVSEEIIAFLDGGQHLAVRNSSITSLTPVVPKDDAARLLLDRCAVWSPGQDAPVTAVNANHVVGTLRITATATLFECGECPVVVGATPSFDWFGSGNAYRLQTPTIVNVDEGTGVPIGLRRIQAIWNSDADSVADDPIILDPLEWQLLPESDGYRARADGKDFGADVSQVARTPQN